MIKYLELYKDYLLVTKGSSINSVKAYIRDIKQYFDVTKGKDIDTYFEYLVKNHYTSSSQNRKISALNGYYSFLMKFNYCDYNPFYNIEFAKKARNIPEYLSYNEVLQIIEVEENNLLNKAIIEVLYGCGLRVSELCSLKISDIHFEEKLIECFGKGSKKRYVPINDAALLSINEYILKYRNKLEVKEDENLLFLNKNGKKIYREYVNVMLDKAGRKARINKKVHPHLFRHTFSTHLLENGANLRSIQTMLGHENLSTTEIYTHIDKKKLIDDYNKYFKE